MLSSMTGFGRASLSTPLGKLVVEIQSVNRKYTEISIALPKEFSRFEPEVRKWVAELSLRGQMTVRVHFFPEAEALSRLLPSSEILSHLKSSWEKIAIQAGFSSSQIDLPFIMLNFPFQQRIDLAKDEDVQILKQCVESALKELKEMRQKEGKALAFDLENRLKMLEKIHVSIESLAPRSIDRLKEKMHQRIEEFLSKKELGDAYEKLLHEVALFAEKIDIAEEITRLKSHFVQFREILKNESGSVGRKMDFLVQEIGREINTIGSKSVEPKISYLVVEMKSELEKMREQIQNIA
jgi:uncharacterized protein (TIGR00255 family)